MIRITYGTNRHAMARCNHLSGIMNERLVTMCPAQNNIQRIYAFVIEYHRHTLWILLGVLFGLDIITTTLSLQRGNSEQNPFMVPFVDNPLLHGIVKIIAFVIFFIAVEKGVEFIHEKRPEKTPFLIGLNFEILYGIIIFTLVYLIWLYLHVVASNIRLIS